MGTHARRTDGTKEMRRIYGHAKNPNPIAKTATSAGGHSRQTTAAVPCARIDQAMAFRLGTVGSESAARKLRNTSSERAGSCSLSDRSNRFTSVHRGTIQPRLVCLDNAGVKKVPLERSCV